MRDAAGLFELVKLSLTVVESPFVRSRNVAARKMAASQLGATLSGDEIDLIETFLDSLTVQQPSVVYPTLPPSVTSSPHPEK